MAGILYDASVYISWYRGRDSQARSLDVYDAGQPIWLHGVTAEELYLGAKTQEAIAVLDRFVKRFVKAKRLIVPTWSDWIRTGQVLRSIGVTHGFEHVGRFRLTGDALIAVTAGRLKITVVTANKRDFEKLAPHCDALVWKEWR